MALLFATLAFGVAEVLLSEAGLFATVTMGFVAANQRFVATRRIRGFGDTLEVLIIGTLFILLGSLVEISALREYALPRDSDRTGSRAGGPSLDGRTLALGHVTAGTLTGHDRVDGTPRHRGRSDYGAVRCDPLRRRLRHRLHAAGRFRGHHLHRCRCYGLSAKPAAGLLGVALSAPKGVGLVGDDPVAGAVRQRAERRRRAGAPHHQRGGRPDGTGGRIGCGEPHDRVGPWG